MQVTITIPDDQVPRIKDWMLTQFATEDENGDPVAPPTDAELLYEFKQKIKRWVKGEVQQFELLREHENLFASYTQIDIQD
jgi:hypothetical protein